MESSSSRSLLHQLGNKPTKCNLATSNKKPMNRRKRNKTAEEVKEIGGGDTKKQKRKIAAPSPSLPSLILESVLLNCFKFGNVSFNPNGTNWFITTFEDYEIISSYPIFDNPIESINNSIIPNSIKPLLSQHWLYRLDLKYKPDFVLDRNVLRRKVTEDKILSFMYAECSVGLNNCVYYGFLPTLTANVEMINDCHKICRVSAVHEWPRKIYIEFKFLDYKNLCCENLDKCAVWRVKYRDGTYSDVCIRKVKWEHLYCFMGNSNINNGILSGGGLKSNRVCDVCAQCYKCSQSFEFCRKHKVCKHKRAKLDVDHSNLSVLLGDVKINQNKRIII